MFMEASALDGAHGWKFFRGVTFPMVRSTFIVVLATMVVSTLKLFDIVRAIDWWKLSVPLFLQMRCTPKYLFDYDAGRGAAMAIVLFLLVIPVLVYNIINLRRERDNLMSILTRSKAPKFADHNAGRKLFGSRGAPPSWFGSWLFFGRFQPSDYFATSFRPKADISATGWWNIFFHPHLTFANYYCDF